MGKGEKSSHGSNNGSALDGAQTSISKTSRLYNRCKFHMSQFTYLWLIQIAKVRYRDVVPTVEHSTPELSPRASNASVPDFPRTIGQPSSTSYQVHYTTAPYQVNNPITASSTWPMAFSQPDLSAPMLSAPQMSNNSSAAMSYLKHHHSAEEDLSVYNRGNGHPPNFSDQNAHVNHLQ